MSLSYINGPDVVKYACTCGLLKPISKLYFCRHCLELRCTFCLSHEVETTFCDKCAENLTSSEARMNKNRCRNCLDCPSCKQQLTIKAASVEPKNPDEPKATPQKVYYLVCLVCRWSSRDVGIPDQTAVSGGWPERENINENRLIEIQQMFKGFALLEKQEKLEKEKKKSKRYTSYTDRTGVTAAMLRKRLGLPDHKHPLLQEKPKKVEPSLAAEDVDELPELIFTESVNLCQVTTVEQRLMQPEGQPTTVDKLYPAHKQLSVKRSQRCRVCQHNVSKPEYNPNSIKFKIQLFAYYHIPEIRIVTVEPLRAGKVSELLLKFSNPTQHQTNITFQLLNVGDDNAKCSIPVQQKETAEEKPKAGSQPSSLLSSLSRQSSLIVKARPISMGVTSDVDIPNSSFILPPRDDAAEYDDSGDTHNIQDDTKLVMWRKSNKAVVKLQVTPNDNLKIGDEVVVAFCYQHVYVNTITTVENKEPQKCDHKVRVFLTLGNVVGSN